MAEGVGFEPTVELPLHGISSAAPSATRPPLPTSPTLRLRASTARPSALSPPKAFERNLAEGRGFEPPRDLRPYPISSRTPSTGLGHPSAPLTVFSFERTHSVSHRMPGPAPPRSRRR